jgi:urease accessory protein
MNILPRALGVGRSDRYSDTIALDYDERRKRRVVLTASGGLRFSVDLPHAPDLKHGDAYRLEDGRFVLVEAAPEQLIELTCDDPHHLTRLAWHLGNRHLPCEIGEASLRIRADHVIADMARGLGARVRELTAPFQPEKGAYHEH